MCFSYHREICSIQTRCQSQVEFIFLFSLGYKMTIESFLKGLPISVLRAVQYNISTENQLLLLIHYTPLSFLFLLFSFFTFCDLCGCGCLHAIMNVITAVALATAKLSSFLSLLVKRLCVKLPSGFNGRRPDYK